MTPGVVCPHNKNMNSTQTLPIDAAKIQDSKLWLVFILAGNATFTVRSTKTGTRYTFKVVKADPQPGKPETWFVKFLSGSDNENDFTYLGMIRDGHYGVTKASMKYVESTVNKAFTWLFGRLVGNLDVSQVEIWHEGRCGRCGRKLTVPESIDTGFGPECATKLGV